MNKRYKEVKNRMHITAYNFTKFNTSTRAWEVNTTLLAEDTCDYFYDYEEDGSINQRYYDIAYEVAIAHEKELNEK